MTTERERLVNELLQAGRESSRLSVLFRSVAVNRLGITVADGECLDFLLEAGTATAGQIAAQTNLTTGAVTSMIRRLERHGYISSQRDPADQRRVLVRAIPEKLFAAGQIYSRFATRSHQLTDGYTNEELAFLTTHYQRVSDIYRDLIVNNQ